MDLGLSDKRALVTGSSQGLGYAIAAELLQEGAAVTICGRDAQRLKTAENRLSGKGRLYAVQADLNTPEGVEHVLTMADAHMGRVDVLCMSTGGPPPGTFATVKPEQFTEAANNLIESLVRLIKGVMPGMVERGWGRVMAVTSTSLKQPVDQLILSNTMRAGIGGLMKSLSNEHAKDGITFNCLMPGLTETERLSSLIEMTAQMKGVSYDAALANYVAPVPAGRVGRPEEFAALAAFLASERASYITGCNIPVDGGAIKGL